MSTDRVPIQPLLPSSPDPRLDVCSWAMVSYCVGRGQMLDLSTIDSVFGCTYPDRPWAPTLPTRPFGLSQRDREVMTCRSITFDE